MYRYNERPSKKSDELSACLTADVLDLLERVKAENRCFTHLDRRNFANNFFIAHSLQIAAVGEVKDFLIQKEVKGNFYEIPARLYMPAQPSNKLVFFIHGGGWTQGNLDTHDYLCKKMADTLECKVLSVSYRLAPEHKFPEGLQDICMAYDWCVNGDSGDILGSVSEIYLSGDSSGGNLAAALNLKLKIEQKLYGDKSSSMLPAQLILFYPVLSANTTSPSFEIFKDQIALTAAGSVFFTEQYTGTKIDDLSILANEFIFPILGDPKAYPKTIMVAAECDVLLDGQLELFDRLKETGVPVKLLIKEGTIHGFMTYGKEFDMEVTEALHKVKEWIVK